MGLLKTRRLAYPPLAGADDPWGSRQAERCECRAMQKQQRAKAGMKVVKPCSKFQGSSFEAGLKIRLRENGGR